MSGTVGKGTAPGASPTTIIIWFSYGTSLEDWRRMGLLERQRPLLRMLAQRFDRVILATYGTDTDRDVEVPEAFQVLVKPAWCPRPLYLFLAPWCHRRAIRQATRCKQLQRPPIRDDVGGRPRDRHDNQCSSGDDYGRPRSV